ncbi:prosaposin-like isoform X1 [Anguilla rostrata]|uniref:prosaposin-like isoform X1 n=1 Tax=Anguilla rostrata TaxID=7938 RepID=UPI0030D169DB
MTASGFVLVALLASQSAVLARVLLEPTQARLDSTKLSATQDGCKDCTQIVELFDDLISKAKTQELIENTLDSLCARLSGDEAKDACRKKAQQYLPIALRFLAKFLKPGQVCTFLGLCGSQSEGKEVELLTNHIADGDMTSVAPFRGTHPEVQLSPQCTFCLFLVKKLESMLGTEKTEDAVVKLLNEVCAILPHSFRAQCEGFIAKYAKQLIEFLLSSAAPHTVCMWLHLCLVQELPLVEMPPLSPCDSCQTLTALSRIHLGSNLTEHGASSFLESVCELHPHAVPKCQVFTQRYGSRLQRILGKQEDALDMCEREDLCAAGSEAMMLGGNHCTWGRDYVCANMKTALECDSVLFCQKFMWN